MNIESKEIYDEVANYVNNINAWEEAVKDWEKIPADIYHDNGNLFTGEFQCDKEEPKEWRVDDGNISAANWPAINHKKINLSLYVVGALKNHMVTNIDELN